MSLRKIKSIRPEVFKTNLTHKDRRISIDFPPITQNKLIVGAPGSFISIVYMSQDNYTLNSEAIS